MKKSNIIVYSIVIGCIVILISLLYGSSVFLPPNHKIVKTIVKYHMSDLEKRIMAKIRAQYISPLHDKYSKLEDESQTQQRDIAMLTNVLATYT